MILYRLGGITMDCAKIGRLIAQLRKEKGLTQKNIADALSISNKTVSKWECGLGCPDVSLWSDLSVILGIDMKQMMDGEITMNQPDQGNINKIRFYVCPSCNNILFSTGSSSIFCCGRNMEQLTPIENEHTPQITVEVSDTDYFITINHEMTRDHYILFAAYVKSDRVYLNRLYPEQNATVRIPYMPGGKLYIYCVKHGLVSFTIKRK